MTTINLRDNRQVVDYLTRDYDGFRQALIDLIPAKLPEWTDRSEADFGLALIELFSYMADILSYYQDRIANEAFLSTAQERRSVIEHLKLVGYEMAPAAAASARLSVVVANSATGTVEVRKGDQFATPSSKDRKSVTFEYTDEKPLAINLDLATPDSARKPDNTPLRGFKEIANAIPVREGRSITKEVIGVSTGQPNQRFRLAQPRLLRNTLEIVVDTPIPTPAWRLRKHQVYGERAFTPEQLKALEYQDRIAPTLAFSRSADPDYTIETDENEVTFVVFGDGQYGQIPPTGMRILATYRVGGGTIGNVASGQIKGLVRAPQLQLLGAKVVNRLPASGGAERETIEQAIKYAPTVFASMQRAVTADDYVALARLFPGVSKARAETTNWNTIRLYVAPTGSGEQPTDVLKQDLKAYFEDKRMVTTLVEVESPDYVPIQIRVEVGVLAYFVKEKVQADAEQAIRQMLDFEQVDFAQVLYLSKVYELLEALDGVEFVLVRRFSRAQDDDAVPPESQPDFIPSDGRIVMSVNEIPVLRAGGLQVIATGGV